MYKRRKNTLCRRNGQGEGYPQYKRKERKYENNKRF